MTAEARRLAREVTAKSVVLLKNKNLLPLDAGKLRKIAVIGPYSDKIVQDWYSGTPPYETTILSGIRNAVKEGTEVIHAEDNRMDQGGKGCRSRRHRHCMCRKPSLRHTCGLEVLSRPQ
ncbi:glycoside hydrolase family 3 C-terminal domain-containing protein [Bacteroides uniformis]|nr:glycoside hydrolase family 3 C-terminal domain-containing protein [Bacteroides uniformis]